MNEFLEQFLIESRELIAQASDDLLALEHASGDAGRFDSAFRAMHTLKGAAGIMDFDAMARVCHAAEDRLSTIRVDAAAMTPALINDCLACLDQMTEWLAAMEASEALPEMAEADAARLVARLAPGGQVAGTALSGGIAEESGERGISVDETEILHEQVELLSLPRDDGAAGRDEAALRVIRHILRRFDLASEPGKEIAASGPAAAGAKNAAARPMRANMARIDAVMRLSGELVVLKNALGHAVELALQDDVPKQHSRKFARLHGELDRLAADLLHASVAARVLPLRQVFQRFPRLVREMAAGLAKKIRLVTEGDATEADRLIVEALFEPLLHVLRNAVDHGVEPEAERLALGKPSPAIIRLSAARTGDEVIVEIADDGRGIDAQAIRATARKRGVADAETLAAMPEDALRALIFAPGFSTAGSVSNLSGRGVGMDAVRAAIDGLGGRIELHSVPGTGTVIRFRLPFTVLLTRVLQVEAGGQAFGIPFEAVAETLQFRREEVARLGAAETIPWRGRTLPLIALAEALHLPDAGRIAPAEEKRKAVIVAQGGEWSALEVDGFGGQAELLLKPLDGLLAGMKGVAGTALLGDGRVLVVLELQDLMK